MGDSDFWFYVIVLTGWSLFFGGIGGAIGNFRGQPLNGFVWGVLLGPIGWLIIVLLSQAGTKCPECLGVVPAAARRCRHCGELLVKPIILQRP